MEGDKLIKAIKLLHSSAPDSAKRMRKMVNTEILKHYDKSKLIENRLKIEEFDFLKDQESKAVGSGFKSKKHEIKKIEELKRPPVISQQFAKPKDIEEESSENDIGMDLNDLSCLICRQVNSSADNQLFECVECQQLFHQLCLPKKINSDAHQSTWTCTLCENLKKVALKYKLKREREKLASLKKSKKITLQ